MKQTIHMKCQGLFSVLECRNLQICLGVGMKYSDWHLLCKRSRLKDFGPSQCKRFYRLILTLSKNKIGMFGILEHTIVVLIQPVGVVNEF